MDEGYGDSAESAQHSSSGSDSQRNRQDDDEEVVGRSPIIGTSTSLTPGLSGTAKQWEPQYIRRIRLGKLYNRRYVELLNEAITEVALHFEVSDTVKFNRSQYGGSVWSPREKDVFFGALTRYGRDDLPKIAAAIRTKSAIEVRDYLVTLQDGFVEHNLNAEKYLLVAWVDVPAAVEIGPDLEARLDLAADAVKERLWRQESTREKEKWGALWCVDPDVASRLKPLVVEERRGRKRISRADQEEEALSESPPKRIKLEDEDLDSAIAQDGELRQATELFNVEQWLSLQGGLFMNAGDTRINENWRSIATDKQEPSIMRTALVDFHRLAITLTKRLVSAAQFQAMMRLRATDVHLDRPVRQPNVTERDVTTALDNLDMARNSDTFWIYTARRCGVRVVQEVATEHLDQEESLSYEEVESQLGGPPVSTRTHTEDDDSSDSEMLDTSEAEQAALDAELHDYAEAQDQRARQRQEADLLDIFGEEVAQISSSADPERPSNKRWTEAVLVDWQDWTERRPSWER